MKIPSINWPPAYVIKKHPLAKYVKLRPSLRHGGLEITVPLRFNLRHIPSILEKNRYWIIEQIKKLPPKVDGLPQQLQLPAFNEDWQLLYRPASTRLKITLQNQQIIIIGDVSNQKNCIALLIKWLKKYAQIKLPALLTDVSKATNLHCQKVTIRDQVSRWGSCSNSKSINLNYKLIFLPMHLIRHVMIHELCHTLHLNHSVQFWMLIAEHDQSWRENKKALKSAHHYVPEWILL